jgi:glutaredoxin
MLDRRIFHKVILTVAMLCVGVAEAASIKKWVDENGKTHYGERPPAEAESADVKANLNVADAVEAPASGVVLYTTAWCGYCKRARQYLNTRGIAFVERDIEKDASANRAHKLAGGKGVPLLVRGGDSLSGFSAAGYDRFFAPD